MKPLVINKPEDRKIMSKAPGSSIHNNTRVGLFTGGSDKPYAIGIAQALSNRSIEVDFIGSDELDCPEIKELEHVKFMNLRGDQSENRPFIQKAFRLAIYYFRLVKYAAFSKAPNFHILWNNKFEWFDRTLLMFYYRIIGKKIFMTAHNINKAKRDGHDSIFNRWTLWCQYRSCHHIFVHTRKMQDELLRDFGVGFDRSSVIPFGINDTIPKSGMKQSQARLQLNINQDEKTILFFGQIAPYKGLKYLVHAFKKLIQVDPSYSLLIAGKVKQGHEAYWNAIENDLEDTVLKGRVSQHIGFIPDSEVEKFFVAADVVVLPYLEIFQSGVPFLAYSFGLPVIATDVGSIKEDVIEGTTGMICKPLNSTDLAGTITSYFESKLFSHLERRRTMIREFAVEKNSWEKVAEITVAAYSQLH